MTKDLVNLIKNPASYPGWAVLGELMLRVLVGVIGAALVFALGRWLVRLFVRRVFTPIIERERNVDAQRAARLFTLQTVVSSVLLYALYFIVFGIILDAFGVNTSSLFATAGIAGVAIGFGAQKVVRDVVTGFLLLLENQFSVGDLVSIGGNTGIVEETGMRTTRLRDENGRMIILSNGDITQVINFSRGAYRIAVDVAVAADTDPAAVQAAVQDAEKSLEKIRSKAGSLSLKGITAMSGASVTYRVEGTAPPTDRVDAEAQIRAALRTALAAREVKLT